MIIALQMLSALVASFAVMLLPYAAYSAARLVRSMASNGLAVIVKRIKAH